MLHPQKGLNGDKNLIGGKNTLAKVMSYRQD